MSATIQLGEVVKLRKGKKAQQTYDQEVQGSRPYIQIDEVRGVTPKSFASDPRGVEVKANDLCIVWDGANAGTVGYGVEGIIGSTVARMRLNCPEEWDARFIGRLLQSKFRELNDQAEARGATIPHVDKSKLESIALPRLPKSEQQQIAAILDKADGARRKREHALTMTEKVLQSVFMEMFGDPVENPKGFIVEEIGLHLSSERAGTQSGPFGSVLKKREYVEKGIPVWGVDNVQQNQFVDIAKLFITAEKFDQLERYSVLPGDVLISRAGTVGRMCVANPSVDKSIISTNLVRVTLDEDSLLPEFFVSLFTYVPHRLAALKANNKDNAFTFLNPKTLRASKIPIPPVELQEEYRRFAKKIEAQVDLAKSQLAGLDHLFASLSQRAFRGELKVPQCV